MDVSQIAAIGVANQLAMTQQAASMSMVKKAADAQMQMVNMIAQQVAPTSPQQGGFSVYA
ncbi:hypothetical protein L4X63_04585 [Geomonas sp. Red32]|uniref:hypothetical protein n=1 Tax=Geomonas sp. Red32 TaxID=2912856 RepID=UPI00202CB813|nr:hypothetical protein [Geomonas sp. Red32]MCM0080863.1 hypothetical protein [Geomonas sp. Red32]